MKTFQCLIAARRPASSNMASRIAISALVIGAALALVQPCAGLSFKFQATGSLAVTHSQHTAALLPNGRMLVAGGIGTGNSTAELYIQATGTWTTTGSLIIGRTEHTATLLPDGKVLVAGGTGNVDAELYDPVTGIWTATGDLAKKRWSTRRRS